MLNILSVEKIPHTIKMGIILHEDKSPRQYDKSDKPRNQTTIQIGASGKVSNVECSFVTEEGGKK